MTLTVPPSETFAGNSSRPRPVGPAIVAAAAAALLALAFAWHPVGDYYAESDFYGGYSEGARLLLRGHVDPARYGVVGPVYEAALAGATLLVKDPFVAARLLSVAAAIATLGLWHRLVRRRLGPEAAAWSALLLAANPVFVRHGYSATTDLPAVALQAAVFHALFGGAAPRAAVAGGLSALAGLTRYSSLYVVPVALVWLAWPAPGRTGPRGRQLALYLAGFAAIAGPWLAFSLSHGHVPGEVLVRSFGFYFDPTVARNVQDALETGTGPAYPSLGEIVARPGAALPLLAVHLREHLRGDATALLGWPAALLAAAGFAAAFTRPWRAAAAPIGLALAAGFLALLPVFHSARYGLMLAPLYLAFSGLAVAGWAGARRRPVAVLARLAGGLALAGTLVACVREQREVRRQLPVEVLAAARELAARSPAGARVMSRKGHIGHYAGRAVAAFPRRATLAELAADARRQGADWLYYSWYDAFLRPEFAWLLDTTAAVPGLAAVHVSDANPAVLFRIGPGFGTEPAWMADEFERRLHEARARIAVDPDSAAWTHRVVLGVDALRRDRPAFALEMVSPVTRDRPREPLPWVVLGEAQATLGRPDSAAAAFRRALALDPADDGARAGLGRALLALGRAAEARDAWRPIVERTTDPALLREMAEAFAAGGEDRPAGEARRRLQRPDSTPSRAGGPARNRSR